MSLYSNDISSENARVQLQSTAESKDGIMPNKSASIPSQMTAERRWVVWAYEERGSKPSKVPYRPDGHRASSTNPDHWVTYNEAQEALNGPSKFSGVGFVLGDGWAGVDMDDVIEDGNMLPWAEELLGQLDSYAEISPSGNGVKVFVKGEFEGSGKNVKNDDGSGCEVYCRGRYFTVTGDHFGGTPAEINEASATLAAIRSRFHGADKPEPLPAIDDAAATLKRKLLAMPESVEGSDGSGAMFHAACEIRRHDFDGAEGLELLRFYNEHRALPSWEEPELLHKWDDACREVPIRPGATPRVEARFDLGLISDAQFAAETFEQEYLIDRAVVGGEHLVVGGPKKTLKTSFLVDLAMSLAAGKPFLGHFDVKQPQPAIIVSGESGGATLQETARRVRHARQIDPRQNLHWGLRLPNLTLPEHLDALRRDIERTGAKLAAIDPAYLALLGGDGDAASNVFKMGNVLAGFGAVGVETGCTLCLVHHTRGGASTMKVGRMPNLGDLSMAGFAEWARQWILLNHAKPRSGGRMQLNMAIGGSAGHGGEYLVDVDESGDFSNRNWGVSIEDLGADKSDSDQRCTPVDRLAQDIDTLLVERVQSGNWPIEFTSADVERWTGVTNGSQRRKAIDKLLLAGAASFLRMGEKNAKIYEHVPDYLR